MIYWGDSEKSDDIEESLLDKTKPPVYAVSYTGGK